MPSGTWTNVDLSSVRSSGIHLRAISLETPQQPFTTVSLKITYLKLNWNLPGANELSSSSMSSYFTLSLPAHIISLIEAEWRICVGKLHRHWFNLAHGFDAWTVKSHHMNQCWLIIHRTLGNKFSKTWINIQLSLCNKMDLKMSYGGPFVSPWSLPQSIKMSSWRTRISHLVLCWSLGAANILTR